MNTTVDKHLLFAHFANTTTTLQKQRIEEWLRQETNQDCFYAWRMEWELQNPPYIPDLEGPLQRFVSHMTTWQQADTRELVNIGAEPITVVMPLTTRYRWLAAASVGVLLLLAGWLGRNYLRYQTYQTAYGETRTLHLPDGSTVALNAHSALRVPRFGFTGGKGPREVLLTGEAYFSVTHRPDSQPFIVKTAKGFEVLVHGTKFTVSTHAYRARVMLQTGKVQVNYGVGPAQKQLMLRPGDLVRLDQPASPVVQHRVVAEPYVAWIRHRFLFDNMTLRDFGHLLSDTYGLKVVIPDPAVARRTLAGSFRADSADELLTTVSEIFDLQVAREGSTVRLTQRD